MVGRLHQRVNALAVTRRDRDIHLADAPLRQAVREARPRFTRIARLPDSAARATAVHRPGGHLHFPRTGIKDTRVLLVHREARAPRLLIDEEHAAPTVAAVAGAEHTPLLLRTRHATDRADIHDVGVCRMDDDLPDPADFLETHILPGLSGIGRLVDAVAGDVRVADHPRLAGPGPDDVVVRLRDGERTDRLHAGLVKNRHVGRAVVGRLEDAARGVAEIPGVVVTRDASDGGDSTAVSRPDELEPERVAANGWRRRCGGLLCGHGSAR